MLNIKIKYSFYNVLTIFFPSQMNYQDFGQLYLIYWQLEPTMDAQESNDSIETSLLSLEDLNQPQLNIMT